MCQAGQRPLLQRLDNECSESLKDYMHDEGVNFQLVPPGVHRRNAAERAIQTFQNHFIAILCGTDHDFPLHLWDQLLPQALLTLNLLHGSRLNQKLSAWSHMNGPCNYNRTPLAPPGTRVLVHEKPVDRETWSPHGIDGWYVGPALDSYICYRTWILDTRRKRIRDTLEWFSMHVTMPLASSIDLVVAGTRDIIQALNNPSASSPLAPLTDSETQTLRTLATVLTNRQPTPAAQALPVPTPQTVPPPTPAPAAPALRVPTPVAQQPSPALRVAVTDAPLRVPPGFGPLPNVSPTTTKPANPQCPNSPAAAESPSPPDPATELTYTQVSGLIGRKRRPNARKQAKQQSTPPPTSPAKPPLPTKQRSTPRPRARLQARLHQSAPPKPLPRTASPTNKPRRNTRTESHTSTSRRIGTRHNHNTRSRANLATTSAEIETVLTGIHTASPSVSPEFAYTAIHPDTGESVEYNALLNSPAGPAWEAASADEIGRLAQGHTHPNGTTVAGTDTIHFIHVSQMPKGRKAAYLKIVAADKPNKDIKQRVRFTAGGNRVVHLGDCSTKTAGVTTA
jgi:hypothetical protein